MCASRIATFMRLVIGPNTWCNASTKARGGMQAYTEALESQLSKVETVMSQTAYEPERAKNASERAKNDCDERVQYVSEEKCANQQL